LGSDVGLKKERLVGVVDEIGAPGSEEELAAGKPDARGNSPGVDVRDLSVSRSKRIVVLKV
jgi:hypothetical protein